MANDFYSDQMTSNADGTLTPWRNLGDSHRYGVTKKNHIARVDIPGPRTFATGDRIVFAYLPTDTKIFTLGMSGTLWPGGTINLGIYKVNENGSVGEKVSAASDILFSSTPVDLTTISGLDDEFEHGILHTVYDRGLQMWELVNLANAGTYAANPGGDFALAAEFVTGITTVTLEFIQWDIEYLSTGN